MSQHNTSTEEVAALEAVDLDSINNVGMLVHKPVLALKTLDVDVEYYFSDVRLVPTVYGVSMVVEFDEFQVYLPKRFASCSEQRLAFLNNHHNELSLVCKGARKVGSGNVTYLIKFVKRGANIVGEDIEETENPKRKNKVVGGGVEGVKHAKV